MKLLLCLLLLALYPSSLFAQADSLVELAVLDSVLKRYETPMQHFKVSASKSSTIVGAKGLIVDIDPALLRTKSGKSLRDSISVELKELTTLEEVMRDRVEVYNSKRLRFMYYLMLKAGGEELTYAKKNGAVVLHIYKRLEESEIAYGNIDCRK